MMISSLHHLPLDAQERLARHHAVTVQHNDALRQLGVAHAIWTPINRIHHHSTDTYRKEENSSYDIGGGLQ